MPGCNYYPCKADTCLFMKKVKDDEPISFVNFYVDDGGNIGNPEAIKEVVEALGNTFKTKSMGEMDKFVGCHIIDTPDKDGVWSHKP
jgi:hypothetical protein